MTNAPNAITAAGLRIGYGRNTIVADLDLTIPGGAVTAIVGPNACGKSTLLRGLRDCAPAGRHRRHRRRRPPPHGARALARRLGLLPQQPTAPEGITVDALVRLGRYPHQRALRPGPKPTVPPSKTLWPAPTPPTCATAGRPPLRRPAPAGLDRDGPRPGHALLLLDEPTTFLDLRHQLDVLDLVPDLNATAGTTVVMVLHDLSQAARYADHLVVMRGGAPAAAGAPADVLTAALVEDVFGVACRVVPDPRPAPRWWSRAQRAAPPSLTHRPHRHPLPHPKGTIR